MRCPRHEDCPFNNASEQTMRFHLTPLVLPPQGRDAINTGPYPDGDFGDPDPDGFEADMAAERMYDR